MTLHYSYQSINAFSGIFSLPHKLFCATIIVFCPWCDMLQRFMVGIQNYLGVMIASVLFLSLLMQKEDGRRYNFLGPNLIQEYGGCTDPWQEWRQAASWIVLIAQPVTTACNYLPTTTSLYVALIRVHLEYCTQFVNPQYRKMLITWRALSRGPSRWSRAAVIAHWGQAEQLGLVQPGEELAAGERYNSPSYLRGGYQEQRQVLCGKAWWEDMRSWWA